jgi:hypothetical protein
MHRKVGGSESPQLAFFQPRAPSGLGIPKPEENAAVPAGPALG